MRLWMLAVVAVVLTSVSCANHAGFKGGGGQGNQPAELAKTSQDQVAPDGRSASPKVAENADSQSASAPKNAVHRGSSTAWADPARPAPRQAYWIYIEVRLPPNAGRYEVQDLSGRLIGTDGYTRGVGRDSRGALDGAVVPNSSSFGNITQDHFRVNGQTARIAVWVPGAEELVRDTVNIRSELLNESQALEIVFQ